MTTTRRRYFPAKVMQYHKRTPETSSQSRIRIEDHSCEVMACDFHPSGKFLLSGNRFGKILICDIYGSFPKTLVLKEHRGAVTEARFAQDGFNIYSCSTDKTIGVWDAFRGYRKATLFGHASGVNSVEASDVGQHVLCSGSDDFTVRIWDARHKQCAVIIRREEEVTATCFSKSGQFVISGGVDENISICDLRNRETVCTLRGHKAKITGISLSPCGSYLVSNSLDGTLRVWDIRPEATTRCISRIATQQPKNGGLRRCAWSPDGSMVSAGSCDNNIRIWDPKSGNVLDELSGHEAAVNDIVFHPKERLLLSGGNDKYAFLHKINEKKS